MQHVCGEHLGGREGGYVIVARGYARAHESLLAL